MMKSKIRKIPTPESLARAALDYLARYAASEASLRRVLENRLRRAALQNPAFAADDELRRKLQDEIDRIVEKYKKTGVLNDAFFAEVKVNALRRQGRSMRAIKQKLAAKGLSFRAIAAALEKNADDATPEDAEYAAAMALVKRRKIGPFRKPPASDETKRKDYAMLARAGFPSAVIRRVLGTESCEEAWE